MSHRTKSQDGAGPEDHSPAPHLPLKPNPIVRLLVVSKIILKKKRGSDQIN